MEKTKTSLLLITLLFLNLSISAQKLKIEPPIINSSEYVYSPSETQIFIPIKLSLNDLTNKIKDSSPNEFSGSIDGVHDGKYSVKVSKISYTTKKGEYRVDGRFVDGDASGTLGVNFSGNTYGINAEIHDIRGHVYIEPRLRLNKYNIKTNLFMDSYVDNAQLRACRTFNLIIGSTTICSPTVNITSILKGDIEHHINNSKDGIKKNLEDEFAKLDLKNKSLEFWNSLHQSKPLDSLQTIWLNIIPSNLFLEQFNCDRKFLNFGIGLTATTQISNEKRDKKPLPIPEPVMVNKHQMGLFNLKINNKYSYAFIERVLNDSLKNYIIEHNEKPTAQIKDVDVKGGKNGKLIIGLKLKGLRKPIKKTRGWLYIEADIAFDEKSKLLYVSDYELSSNTSSFIINNSIELLGNHLLYKKTLEKLEISIKDDLDKELNELDDALRDGIPTSLGKLNGTCNEFELSNINLSQKYLYVDFNLQGKLIPIELNMKKLIK